ncbi:GntR family transcriptional regulator [Dinoroseobacter sp. S76]|uniref:GntR family transcriptional regulator n=1 Tax=Dinoroseobacter sp. S76 TaxID=3415124 RepID=UPI003C7BB4E8
MPRKTPQPQVGTPAQEPRRSADREMIADKIRLDITRGVLGFGQRISESAYAEACGVSRTPVREALMMLMSLDLVTVRPKHGTFVTSFTKAKLREIFAVRLLLETGGVEMANAFQRATLVQDLDRELARMRAPASEPEGFEARHDGDTVFHRLLVQAAGNAQLIKMYHPVEVCAMAARSRFPLADWVWDTAVHHHETIVEALRRDDLPAFRAALTEHINWSRDALMETSDLFTPS